MREQPQTFKEYVLQARDEFVIAINAAPWNTKMRTQAEDFIIAYDQVAERLDQQYNKCRKMQRWVYALSIGTIIVALILIFFA